MLAFLVSEAFKGVDITRRYPKLYRQILADPSLQEAFLDALEMLEDERAGRLLPVPAERGSDGPPQRGSVVPREKPANHSSKPPGNTVLFSNIEQLAAGVWRAVWQCTSNQVQAIFFPPEPGLAFRRDDSLMEDIWLPLLRGQTRVGDTEINVLLAATQEIKTPNTLQPKASVAFNPNRAVGDQTSSVLHASLRWGNYRATVPVDNLGQAVFPAVLLSDILDKTGRQVNVGLDLTLETHPS